MMPAARHEAAAAAALADLQSLLAAGDYVGAKRLAAGDAQTYADTPQGPQFAAILAQLEQSQAYEDWMARGDAAAATGQWEQALAAFTQAVRIYNTRDVQERLADVGKRVEAQRMAHRLYETAMAAADRAARAGDWQGALDAYRNAASIEETPETRAGIADARRKLIETARDRKRLYDASMADGAARAANDDWPRALDAYEQAAEIDPTPEAKAGVALAKRKIAEREEMRAGSTPTPWPTPRLPPRPASGRRPSTPTAAPPLSTTPRRPPPARCVTRAKLAELQVKARLYGAAMDEAKAAVKAADWWRAQAAYQRAAAIDPTDEAKADVDLAKKQIAEAAAAADKKREYDRLRAEGAAWGKAGQWQKTVEAYMKAAAVDNTPEVQADIAAARKKQTEAAAVADKKKEYTRLMTEADAAAKAGEWQKALDVLTKAAAIDNTREVQADIANAKKKLAEAATAAAAASDKKKEYTRLMAEGDAAAKAGEWQKALDAYTKAAAVDNTAEAKAGVEQAKKKLAEKPKASAAKDPPRNPKPWPPPKTPSRRLRPRPPPPSTTSRSK